MYAPSSLLHLTSKPCAWHQSRVLIWR